MSLPAPSQLIVNLGAYAHNLGVVRNYLAEECTILAVVKADAYGLGAVPIAQRAVREGVSMLGVATVAEGVELRNAGIQAPILVMVHPLEEHLQLAIQHNLRLMVSNVATVERIGELARRMKKVVPIHCEIDTGMGRLGFNAENAPEKLLQLTRISNVDIEGIATHFPVADTISDPFTENQIKAFKQLLRALEKEGIPYDMVHAANSAGCVRGNEGIFNMVRVGLMTYGSWPTDEVPDVYPLRPVVEWSSKVALVKEIPGGASIGYGRTYRAPAPMRAAVVPVGYADGYRHDLSNQADVLIRGKRCPVRGTVSMDQVVVDVTELPSVVAGDAAVLIGRQGNEEITVAELARLAKTIPYEITTAIGRRVERKYVE